MGSKKNAPVKAAEVANQQADRGLDELKRQFAKTEANVQPFFGAGIRNLANTERNSTLGGFADKLKKIFGSGALDPLVEERTRAAQGQLAAGGLTRSGTALETIADIPTELGLAIEQLLSGRQGGLTDLGFNSAQLLGNFGQNSASQINSNLGQQGQNTASGGLGKAQAGAAFTNSALGLGGAFLGAAGAAGGIGPLLAFSDPRLKVDVMEVARIKDLGVYQWDWHPMTKGLKVAETPTLGFMADEVEEKYPGYVKEVAGFKCVAYGPLINLLEHKIAEERRAA